MNSEKTITIEIPASSATRVLEALETVEQKTEIHREMVRALREQIAGKLHDV